MNRRKDVPPNRAGRRTATRHFRSRSCPWGLVAPVSENADTQWVIMAKEEGARRARAREKGRDRERQGDSDTQQR